MNLKLKLPTSLRAVVPIALLAASPAFAQTFTIDCTTYGGSFQAEPLGDRPGHGIQVSTGTCRVSGGLLDGAVFTQQMVWEVNGMTMTMLDGVNVIRKPGALSVARLLSGTNNLIVEDGRPVGFTASGKAQFVVASGAASAYAGKTYSWKTASRTPGRWTGEATLD